MIRKPVFLVTAFAILYFASVPASAQEKQQESWITRVVKVEYVNPDDVAKVLGPFVQSGHAMVVASRPLKALTLSGNVEVVDTMESIVATLDVKPKEPNFPGSDTNIEVTAYLLITSEAPAAGQNMPAPLEPVLKQLRSTFNYKAYQLLDTIMLRGRVGIRESAMADGILSLPNDPERAIPYRFNFSGTGITGETLHFEGLGMRLEFPTWSTPPAGGAATLKTESRGFSTSLDLRVGQMAVVGKTSFDVGNNSLIAVITARIVN